MVARVSLRILRIRRHLVDMGGDSGINKPFDRILKAFADEAPELFLRLLGLATAADIQPLRPESAPAVIMPDYVALVRSHAPAGDGRTFIFHAEFLLHYRSDAPSTMARYGGSLAWQYQLPVDSVLALLRPQGVPSTIPEYGEYGFGSTRTVHPFRVVRLWELDPTPVLETGNPKLLPWALMMKSTDQQVREIASVLAKERDKEALGRFLTVGVIRYDRSTLMNLFGGRHSSLIEAMLDGSPLVQEKCEIARAEGRSEGEAALQRLLKRSHPELASLPEIDRISNLQALESLAGMVVDGAAPDAIRAAIVAAARPKPN
jgi:hypothetical protein